MLSQSVGYAAIALGIIANASDKPMLIRQIAEAGDIPTPYLAKLIHILGRKGIVETQRGIGGGVRLVPRSADINLYRLCEIFDDPIINERCMLGNADCSDARACPCHSFWKAHRKREIHFLKKTTVADVAKFELREFLRTTKGGRRRVSS